jgi:polyhydroxyalkanoate synthesis repressor PhaR
MRLIKRYSNRKLYDTNEKKYITLDQIADLIKDGEDLQVIDNSSGDDLTTLTLTQIILEQEKKQKEFIPRSVLNAMVVAGGKPISSLRKRLEIPLGYLRQIDEEIDSRIQHLVSKGDLSEELGEKLQKLMVDRNVFARSTHQHDEDLQRIIHKYDLPTNSDMETLMEQIDALSRKIQNLE